MNLPNKPDERELILSQYIDGELDPASSAELEACLDSDPNLRAELAELKSVDVVASRTVKRYHRDDRMSKAVRARIKPRKSHQGLPASSRPAPRSRRMRKAHWSFTAIAARAAAVVLFCAGAYYGWEFYQQRQASGTVATTDAKPVTPTSQIVVPPMKTPAITEDVREIASADGTRIWARKGSRVEVINPRSVRLEGEALFHVAKGETPFIVVTDAGQATALGTRFDVKTGFGAGNRVRVAEGRVRVEAAGKSVEAPGGTEVNGELTATSFDPRALMAEWSGFGASNVLSDMVPAWAQVGGNAGRTGITPLSGPATAIVARPEMFFAFPDDQPVIGSAIVDAAGNAFVLRRTSKDSKRGSTLWTLRLGDGRAAAWKSVSDNLLDIAPVVSPEGNVIAATDIGAVALDASGKTLWTLKTEAAPRGICMTPGSTLLIAEDSFVSAWNTRDGQQRWRCNAVADLTGTISVNSANQICVVANNQRLVVIDAAGANPHTYSWHTLAFAPVAADGSNVWLLDKEGRAARMNLANGERQEASFKKAPVAPPLGNGLFGSGPLLQRFDQTFAAKPPAAATDVIMALAQDGRGQVFAAYSSGVLHLQTSTNGTLKEMEFVNVRGEVLPGGLAIAPGRVLLTTSLGLQVFE